MKKYWQKISIWLILVIVIAINFSLGFPRLSRYSAVDEPYWTYDRTPDYWNNIKERDWKGTKINDKPGIMVALISGSGLIFEDPLGVKFMRRHVKTEAELDLMQKINFIFRFPIYLVCLASLLLYYWLIRKLTNQFIALVSFIFIGLSPIILGQSLIINPDSLLWIFMPLSIISYLVYQKNGEKKYLYLASAMMGFSILTKYVANLVYLFVPIMIIFEWLMIENKNLKISEYLKKAANGYLIFIAISMATYYVLFPATWVKFKLLLDGTIWSKPFELIWPYFLVLLGLILVDIYLLKAKVSGLMLEKIKIIYDNLSLRKYLAIVIAIIVLFSIANVYLEMKFYDFQEILASPKSGGYLINNLKEMPGNFFAGYYALLFGLTPIAFFLFLISIASLSKVPKNEDSHSTKFLLIAMLFPLFYYLGSSFSGVGATVRYQIAIYPLAMISAAIGLYFLVKKYNLLEKFYPAIYLALLLVSALSLFLIKPFYLAYASYLLPNQYVLNLKGMGDGNYEVAQYLNNLPNAEMLQIWSDKGGVCESFKGRCIIGHNKNDIEGVDFDYFVSSIDRKSKSMKTSSILRKQVDFKKLYDPQLYDYRVIIGGRENNFVKVVAKDKISKE